MLLFTVLLGGGKMFVSAKALAASSEALAEVGSAASGVVSAGANMSVAVINLAMSVLTTSATAVDEAWYGVDLLDVTLTRTSGKAFLNITLLWRSGCRVELEVPSRMKWASTRATLSSPSTLRSRWCLCGGLLCPQCVFLT